MPFDQSAAEEIDGADISPATTDTGSLTVGERLAESGDFLAVGPSWGPNSQRTFSTTSTTYVDSGDVFFVDTRWDRFAPTGAQTAVFGEFRVSPGSGESVSVRLRNAGDGETIFETTGLSGSDQSRFPLENYTPTTTGGRIFLRYQIKTDPGSNSSSLFQPKAHAGVQL
jgi:hypothetical protein